MKKLFTTLLLFLSLIGFSQTYLTQTIRGNVIDIQTEETLPGATIIITDLGNDFATTSDFEGEFRIENVPIGRHDIQITYVGYNAVVIKNQTLTSVKELVLEVKMEEQVIELQGVTVKAYNRKDKPLNDMATVSARSFTIDETERYAGSLGDPSKMASNFAGVMCVTDQRNDIIIRGNSPTGLLWRLNGVDIPNPNHFAALGTSGGQVGMLNNNLLTNSDFFTGAFPAEYGNALAGAFDINMRNGNNKEYEFLGQIGFNGFELGAEGPFSKKSKASFIINYRYSTLAIFHLLGMNFGTGTAVPQYQDLSFNVNIPTKKIGKFNIFGIGGKSYIEMKDQDSTDYGYSGSNLYYGSDLFIGGLTHTYYFNNSAKISTKISSSGTKMITDLDDIDKIVDTTVSPFDTTEVVSDFYGSNFTELKYFANIEFTKKFNSKNYITTGVYGNLFDVIYKDSVYLESSDNYYHQFDLRNSMYLLRGYFNWQHKFNDNFTMNAGVHSMYFLYNKTYSVEPRFGLKYSVSNHSFSLGFGSHSQLQILPIYMLQIKDTINNIIEQPYKNLGFNKALHSVIGYDWLIAKNFRLKAEVYYQYLYNIPVSSVTPQISVINAGDDFTLNIGADVVSEGKGRNYGFELTLEKFYSKGYYFLMTTSIFDSKYLDYENVWRNTRFNSNYVFNILAGYEFNIGETSLLAFDVKAVYAGGKRIVPIDVEASITNDYVTYDWEHAFENRAEDYYRINARITFKTNGKHISQEWGLDLQNLTNHQNVYNVSWNSKEQKVETNYQQGFMPMMTWRILF